MEDKKLAKAKRLVLKRLPKARLVKFKTGYQIWIDDAPVGVEFFMPELPTVLAAWQNALTSLKTKQNFNRSHPLKIDSEYSEKRTYRIRRRIKRGRKKKETELKKPLSDSNYIF